MRYAIIKKTVIVLSVLLNMILVSFFVVRKVEYKRQQATASTYDVNDLFNKGRVDLFQELPADSSDIVFIGGSITEGFPFAEMFPGLKIKNRGISGNETCHVLNRVDKIVASHPKKVFLQIGINDLKDGVPADSLLKNYIRIIDKIQAIHPRLFVQSIFPVSKKYEALNSDIVRLNGLLKSYCESKRICYVDIASSLTKENIFDSVYTVDGLHPNGAGYEVWRDKIKGLVTP